MKIMKLPLKDIKTNPKNPRQIRDDKFKRLVQSLKDFPEMADVREIVVNKDHIVLGGNMRLKAMQEAGWTEAPVKVVDWTQDKQDEFVVKDNAAFGEWDWDELANQYEVAELIEWGVDLPESLLPEDEVEEDEAPEVSSEPAVSKLGEIYQLGRHRVMCGDSTVKENVDKLMDGAKVDMVFTDPPYGIDVVKKDGNIGGNRKKGKVGYTSDWGKAKVYSSIIGDDKPFDPTFLLDLAPHIILWGANNYASKLPDMSRWIVWDKKDDMQRNNDFSDCELAWTNYEGRRVKKYTHLWAGNARAGKRDSELVSRVHPTQKPVGLHVSILKDYGKDGELVLDLFLGSGSTLIACEQTDRTCYGMELDPKYVDVIRKRYHKFVTGDVDGWELATPVII